MFYLSGNVGRLDDSDGSLLYMVGIAINLTQNKLLIIKQEADTILTRSLILNQNNRQDRPTVQNLIYHKKDHFVLDKIRYLVNLAITLDDCLRSIVQPSTNNDVFS
ncbi:MAG: hypothetical protein AB7V56_09045 [Candidatus Nitrosocosmicus sp.]